MILKKLSEDYFVVVTILPYSLCLVPEMPLRSKRVRMKSGKGCKDLNEGMVGFRVKVLFLKQGMGSKCVQLFIYGWVDVILIIEI